MADLGKTLNELFELNEDEKFYKDYFEVSASSGQLKKFLDKVDLDDATTLAFTTENERTKSKDADSTVTKDGTVRTPGAAEGEITASSLLEKGNKFIDELEAALDDDEKMEIWEVNLAEPQASSTDKFKAKYFQGYLTEIDKTSNAEDNVELSLTFGLEGKGVDGYATVTAEQQEVAAYVFADTQKTGA